MIPKGCGGCSVSIIVDGYLERGSLVGCSMVDLERRRF